MNKKFKFTDKVTKESIRSPEFKRWLMRILAVVCILSLIFQFSTCVYQGLNAYAADEPVDSSAIGTWVINETVTGGSSFVSYDIDGSVNCYNGVSIDSYSFDTISVGRSSAIISTISIDNYRWFIRFYSKYNSTPVDSLDGNYVLCEYYDSGSVFMGYDKTSSDGILLRTVTITGGDDINNINFLNWLFVNAVKQSPPTVHDFTNEIRVFNDDLTFFITNSTTWTEAFNFNFEVIGVGTADYIVLQRDVNNNYTMSYSYDFEGSGGLRTVYRFNHTTDTGGFFKENTKYIRFITNPENTDFQQWLLDNTTLVGSSDDIESFDTFYDMGFNVGYNSGYEQGFANSLIGDSLSGPINALSSITLIQIGDTVITLGGVIMTAIALCLVLAFLKLYAGG